MMMNLLQLTHLRQANNGYPRNQTDTEICNMVTELSSKFSNAKKRDVSEDNNEINEMELILDEFLVTMQDHVVGGVEKDMKEMLDGWVLMEDTTHEQEQQRAEVEEVMLVEALVEEVAVSNGDDKEVDSEDDDDVDVEMLDEEVATLDLINELSSQLTRLSTRVDNFKCGEHEYDAVATKLRDAASGLLLAYRKVERNKVAKKQGKQPRQAALLPFLKKPPN